MNTQPNSKRETQNPGEGVTAVSVGGYKSLAEERSIEIRPLTILAGANSSGKSSIMQPLLLLKQTLEATYDPGALLLDGPNVRFTSVDQLLSKERKVERVAAFRVGIEVDLGKTVTIRFSKQRAGGLEIAHLTYADERESVSLHAEMTHDEIAAAVSPNLKGFYETIAQREGVPPRWVVVRNRCFLDLALRIEDKKESRLVAYSPGNVIEPHIRNLIHLPGLRGNPERTYPRTAIGPTFSGTFEKYTASIIAGWQAQDNRDAIKGLSQDLERLGLTWQVVAEPVNDTQVELRVGRLSRASRNTVGDLVSIADVGFGVSQTLPVLVALHAAKPDQLVYLEQPELHLHPRAQSALAQVLADAANRGVRVVAETHSALLILAVQSLVAEGYIAPDKVKLHWFKRRDDGITEITSADLDEAGAYGDWPEDFAEVALETESRYLNAAEQRQGQE